MGAVAREEQPNWEKMQAATSCEEKILVLVRLRPLNEAEMAVNEAADWESINNTTMLYRNTLREGSALPNTYTFDRVFRGDCSTRQVFEEGVQEIALSVVSGINSSIFAYGQTSSGKTYTMNGITEYTAADIFDYINKHEERAFVLKFSAIEIYNEAVRDLLSSDATPLRLLDDSERGVIIEKATEETLRDWSHLKELLSVCEAQRRIGETALNEKSSRSHQIVRLTIESTAREFVGKDNSTTLTATVNFIDLAGSERASQAMSGGARLKEGCHINRSLLTLGTVIRKLSKGRHGHINYRDSKLTRILQPCLGGNARTAIICTLSPARSHVEQTRNTLLFACCAKEVSTKAQVNIVMSDKTLVKHLQKEVARLENELKSPITVSSSGDYAALLRKKDLQIQKMEKQMQELTEQRDFAQSRVEDLLRMVGKVEYIPAQGGERNEFERKEETAWDDEYSASESSNVAEPHSLDININGSTDPGYYIGYGENDVSEENYKELQENKPLDRENSLPPSGRKKFVNSDSCQSREVTPSAIVGDSDDCREVQGEICSQCIGNEKEIVSVISGKVNITSQIPASSGHCEWNQVENSLSNDSIRSVKLTKSWSCRDSLSPCSSFSEKPENTPPYLFPRLEASERKLYPLNLGGRFSRLDSQSSENTTRSIKTLSDVDITRLDTFVSEMNERAKLEYEKQKDAGQVQETGLETEENAEGAATRPALEATLDWAKKFESQQRMILQLWHACAIPLVHRTYFFLLFRGDSTDSIYMEVELRRLTFLQDKNSQGNEDVGDGQTLTLASRGNYQSSVHVFLTHSCINFSNGGKEKRKGSVHNRILLQACQRTCENQHDDGLYLIFTPKSLCLFENSTSALHRERGMLSRLMQKRFSEEERNRIFQKWGIALSSKRRRLQLANKLWTNSKDMNHITESAAIVAKLVKFVEQGQALRGMFELSFASSRTKRSYSWKKSVASLI